MSSGDKAWTALGISILIYEWRAPENELLSEACDRYREKHPVLTLGVICLLAAHLSRAIPRNVDPIHLAAVKLNR
jgi:hypothetical protein